MQDEAVDCVLETIERHVGINRKAIDACYIPKKDIMQVKCNVLTNIPDGVKKNLKTGNFYDRQNKEIVVYALEFTDNRNMTFEHIVYD